MPKRSVNEYKPFEALRSPFGNFYSSEDINNVIDAAGGLPNGEVEIFNGETTIRLSRWDGLIAELENLANSYSASFQLQTSPTAKQKAAAFKEMENAARRLLQALSLPEGLPKGNPLEQVPTALIYSALPDFGMNLLDYVRGTSDSERRKTLRVAIEGVYRLKDCAENARRACEQHPPTSRQNDTRAIDGSTTGSKTWAKFGRPSSTRK